MNIEERMNAKMLEIEETKATRDLLFDDFETNKEQISNMYYECERLKLEYMLLKREQLAMFKLNELRKIIIQSIDDAENINECCIRIVQKNLNEAGYKLA